MMSWGWGNVSDVYYSAYSYTSSINYGEYSTPEYSYTYPANWSVSVNGNHYNYNQFQYMIYNIQDIN